MKKKSMIIKGETDMEVLEIKGIIHEEFLALIDPILYENCQAIINIHRLKQLELIEKIYLAQVAIDQRIEKQLYLSECMAKSEELLKDYKENLVGAQKEHDDFMHDMVF